MAKAITIDAPVREVTVMEDRAQITRKAKVVLPPGQHAILATNTSPLIVDRTVRGFLRGPSAKILDVKVTREATVRATRPDEEAELRAELKNRKAAYLAQYHRFRATDAQRSVVTRAISDFLATIAVESGRGIDGADHWPHALSELQEQLSRLDLELHDASAKQTDTAEEIGRIEERRWHAAQPTSAYWGNLHATVEVQTEGEYELGWTYLIPCALWRPSHQAVLRKGESEVNWKLFGTIWQRTGERWDNATLTFSTARPTLGANLPVLGDDELELRPKTDEEKAVIQVQSRDESISATSTAGSDVQIQAVPGVDDGGETQNITLKTPISIPSDGQAHLVELDSFDAECDTELTCAPELLPHVFLKSEQVNNSKKPLLAGPVRLVRNGGFVGRSRVPYVAPGERYSMGWGSEDHLEVSRQRGTSKEEVALGRKIRHTDWCHIYLSNTSDTPQKVTVTERIPVSEIEEVKVTLLERKVRPLAEPDDNGHVKWNVTVPAAGHEELHLAYEVETSKKIAWRP
jgi:uncharacterized protein (TIGR02231 family)